MASEAFVQGSSYYGPGVGLVPNGAVYVGQNIVYGTGTDDVEYQYANSSQTPLDWGYPPTVARNVSAAAEAGGRWENISAASCREEYRACRGRRQYRDLIMILDIQGEPEHYDGW